MKTEIVTLFPYEDATLTCYLIGSGINEKQKEFPRPAMLVLPGGGYRMCSDDEAEPIALAYTANGYQSFVLRYTCGGEGGFERILEEADEAMKTIVDHAEEWSVDPKRIAVVGFSAGGHLAAMLSTSGKIRPAAAVLGYPCTKDPDTPGITPFPLPNPSLLVDEKTPPCFAFAASDDPIVPLDSLPYVSALHAAGKHFEVHIFSRGGHGFSLGTPHVAHGLRNKVMPRVQSWLPLSVEWLEEELGSYSLVDPMEELRTMVIESYSIDIPMFRIFESERGKMLLMSTIPGLGESVISPMAETILSITPRMMAAYMGDALSAEALNTLDRELRKLTVE